MVNGIRLSGDAPENHGSGCGSRHAEAIINSTFNLTAFFVIVPGNNLNSQHLPRAGIVLAGFSQALKPGLSALLPHDAIGAPGRQGIVEAFVCRFHGVRRQQRDCRLIEVIEIAQGRRVSGADGFGRDPGKCSVALGIVESARIAENEHGISGSGGAHAVPVNDVRLMAEEIN